MPYKNILIAVDSSKESKKAFERALQLSKENSASLTVAHVVDFPIYSDYKPYDTQIIDLAKESADDLLSNLKKEAIASGLPDIEIIVKTGSAKRELIKQIIPDVKPDLIILGATGTNALERVLVGSVSEYIIRNAPCDVLVVRN